MYHIHKVIALSAALLSSCVSLREYTELSQDKHRADSIGAARIEMLEERLRQVSSSRLALLQDTLRLSIRLDSMRGCYSRLLRGSDNENAVAMSRLNESRSRLVERERRMDEQAESLGVARKRLAEIQGRLTECEISLAGYEVAAERLRAAIDGGDSTAVADAVGKLLSLTEHEAHENEETINDCNDDKTGL